AARPRLQAQVAVLKAAMHLGDVATQSVPCSPKVNRLRLMFVDAGTFASNELSAFQAYQNAVRSGDQPSANRAFSFLRQSAQQLQRKDTQINVYVATVLNS